MAYENVNEQKLNSALRTISKIDYEKINNLTGKITADQWGSPIRSRIITALNDIVNEYKAIQSELNKYKTMGDYIDEYKGYESDHVYCNKQIDMYRTLLKAQNKIDNSKDSSMKTYYEKKIKEYENKKAQVIAKKREISNKVNNLF